MLYIHHLDLIQKTVTELTELFKIIAKGKNFSQKYEAIFSEGE